MGLLMEAIKDFAFILKPLLWIWLIWTIIMALTHAGGGGVGEGLAGAAKTAAHWFGPKERAQRKKEAAEAGEIRQDANIQGRMVKEEQQAIKWLEASLSPERGIAREIMDDIQRLEWVNKVLQYTQKIRNTEIARRYKQRVEEQLGLVSKHFVSEAKITEQDIGVVLPRIERFVDEELKSLKSEEHARKIIRKILVREIKKEDRRAMVRFLREKKRAIEILIGSVKDIVNKKKELTDKILKDFKSKVERQNKEFNERMRTIISNVWHDQIEEAALNVNRAIELKKEQLDITRSIEEHVKEIEELERKQIDAEQRLKQFLEEFEQNKHRYREETERGARRARGEVRHLERGGGET